MPIKISRSSATTVQFSTPQEIVISHLDDSIKIGDGVDFLAINADGSINANIAAFSAVSPVISNTTSPGTSFTEFSVVIPISTKRFSLQSRGNSRLQLSYIMGASGTTFLTIYPGTTYTEEGLNLTGALTIYLQASKASEIVEAVSWS